MKINASTVVLIVSLLMVAVGLGVDITPSDDVVVPDPPPITADGINILIIEETSARNALPSDQQNIFTSVKLRQWMDDNDVDFRIWDQDVDAKFDDEKWQEVLKGERGSLPWMYASNGKTGYNGPLPESVDAVIEKLEALN